MYIYVFFLVQEHFIKLFQICSGLVDYRSQRQFCTTWCDIAFLKFGAIASPASLFMMPECHPVFVLNFAQYAYVSYGAVVLFFVRFEFQWGSSIITVFTLVFLSEVFVAVLQHVVSIFKCE